MAGKSTISVPQKICMKRGLRSLAAMSVNGSNAQFAYFAKLGPPDAYAERERPWVPLTMSKNAAVQLPQSRRLTHCAAF